LKTTDLFLRKSSKVNVLSLKTQRRAI